MTCIQDIDKKQEATQNYINKPIIYKQNVSFNNFSRAQYCTMIFF